MGLTSQRGPAGQGGGIHERPGGGPRAGGGRSVVERQTPSAGVGGGRQPRDASGLLQLRGPLGGRELQSRGVVGASSCRPRGDSGELRFGGRCSFRPGVTLTSRTSSRVAHCANMTVLPCVHSGRACEGRASPATGRGGAKDDTREGTDLLEGGCVQAPPPDWVLTTPEAGEGSSLCSWSGGCWEGFSFCVEDHTRNWCGSEGPGLPARQWGQLAGLGLSQGHPASVAPMPTLPGKRVGSSSARAPPAAKCQTCTSGWRAGREAGCLGLWLWIRGHRRCGLCSPGPTLELARLPWPLADPDAAG